MTQASSDSKGLDFHFGLVPSALWGQVLSVDFDVFQWRPVAASCQDPHSGSVYLAVSCEHNQNGVICFCDQ